MSGPVNVVHKGETFTSWDWTKGDAIGFRTSFGERRLLVSMVRCNMSYGTRGETGGLQLGGGWVCGWPNDTVRV